jgi:hypothetical protein
MSSSSTSDLQQDISANRPGFEARLFLFLISHVEKDGLLTQVFDLFGRSFRINSLEQPG